MPVMQGTAQFPHQNADALLPHTDPVFDEGTALHTAVDMRDPSPATVPWLVGQCRRSCPCLAAGLLGRHEALHGGSVHARKPEPATIGSQ